MVISEIETERDLDAIVVGRPGSTDWIWAMAAAVETATVMT